MNKKFVKYLFNYCLFYLLFLRYNLLFQIISLNILNSYFYNNLFLNKIN